MIHNLYFFGRKPSVTSFEFHRHYLEVHPFAGPRIKSVKRYIQNHRVHSLGGNSPFDAVSEFWTDMPAALQSKKEEGAKIRIADEEHFIDPHHAGWMATTDRVVMEGHQKSDMIQGVFQLTHKTGMAMDEFRRYWFEVHEPIVRSLPGLIHYQQCLEPEEAYTYGDVRWDGVEEIWFDSYESARKALKSVEYEHSFLPDFARFCEPVWHFYSEVQLVTWPGKSKEQIMREIAAKVAHGWPE
ncbi:MAG TPA: EthD domain-containing protein [Candidatus Binataceae bacterium]|nr:EthD domain-containing protein [Candidatus Binataceae bacterium]